MDILEWAVAEGCPLDGGVCERAAQGGGVEALAWLRERGCPWDARTMVAAVALGRERVFRWIVGHGGAWWGEWVAVLALGAERVDALDWAEERGERLDAGVLECEPELLHLSGATSSIILEWARAKGYEVPPAGHSEDRCRRLSYRLSLAWEMRSCISHAHRPSCG